MRDPVGVASPCVRNCCLDETDVCLGCGRTVVEIMRWSEAHDAERQAICDRARERRAHRDPWLARREPL